jgi:hypothetical protein
MATPEGRIVPAWAAEILVVEIVMVVVLRAVPSLAAAVKAIVPPPRPLIGSAESQVGIPLICQRQSPRVVSDT